MDQGGAKVLRLSGCIPSTIVSLSSLRYRLSVRKRSNRRSVAMALVAISVEAMRRLSVAMAMVPIPVEAMRRRRFQTCAVIIGCRW